VRRVERNGLLSIALGACSLCACGSRTAYTPDARIDLGAQREAQEHELFRGLETHLQGEPHGSSAHAGRDPATLRSRGAVSVLRALPGRVRRGEGVAARHQDGRRPAAIAVHDEAGSTRRTIVVGFEARLRLDPDASVDQGALAVRAQAGARTRRRARARAPARELHAALHHVHHWTFGRSGGVLVHALRHRHLERSRRAHARRAGDPRRRRAHLEHVPVRAAPRVLADGIRRISHGTSDAFVGRRQGDGQLGQHQDGRALDADRADRHAWFRVPLAARSTRARLRTCRP